MTRAVLTSCELKRHVRAQLDAYCRLTGETSSAVINDALVHFFDQEAGAYAYENGRIVGHPIGLSVIGGRA